MSSKNNQNIAAGGYQPQQSASIGLSHRTSQGGLETNGYSPKNMVKTSSDGVVKHGYQPPSQNAPKTVTPPPKKP
ncbi:TPA: hypothetical protein ACS8CD_000285 [Providencia alcalifaciens]